MTYILTDKPFWFHGRNVPRRNSLSAFHATFPFPFIKNTHNVSPVYPSTVVNTAELYTITWPALVCWEDFQDGCEIP
jgi:hypothetical protein